MEKDIKGKHIVIDGEPPEVTEIREKILDAFGDLVFVEEGHHYYLDGVEIPSVTGVIHQFVHPFHEEFEAEKYARNHGETKEYWLDKWKFKNLKATTTGTLVHEFGESYGWLKAGHPELITESCRPKYIKEKGWLVPTRGKEEAVIKFFEELPDDLYFVMNETKVYANKNPERLVKNQYCGTFDLLFYYKHPTDDSKSGLVIYDFKTNASLINEFSRLNNKMMKAPFTYMYDESLGVYTLQLSAYQIPLEDIGLKVIARRIIWLKDDGTYEIRKVPDETVRLREVL